MKIASAVKESFSPIQNKTTLNPQFVGNWSDVSFSPIRDLNGVIE